MLVQFKPEVDVAVIATALNSLKSQIDGIIDISFGENCSPEPLARNNTHAFTVDFRDAAARDTYLSNAAHKAVGKQIVDAAVGGINGVTVIDWELK